MPIDLKWVRQNPELVEEWQRQRGRSTNVVQEVLQKDEVALAKLQAIQQMKRQLAATKQPLRPSKNTSVDDDEKPMVASREELLKEKKSLEDRIKSEEKLWKDAARLTEEALWKVASPVFVPEAKQQESEELMREHPVPIHKLPFPIDAKDVAWSHTGMQLQHALKSFALEFLANYPGIEVSRGLRVECTEKKYPSQSTTGIISVDQAHAIWGCSGDVGMKNDHGEASGAQPSCAFCRLRSVDNSSATIYSQLTLPTWLRLLTDFVPPKTTWGDKQLPVYAAVWSANSDCNASEHTLLESTTPWESSLPSISPFWLDLVALTASSKVDACQIQNDVTKQMTEFYEKLTTTCHSEHTIKTMDISPTELSLHECSRTEIHLDMMCSSTNEILHTACLGRISCWGDAASRACDMTFAGGGVGRNKKHKSQEIKDYVYIVQASVIDDGLWEKVLFANLGDATPKADVRNAAIPLALIPHLNLQNDKLETDGSGNYLIAWTDLFVSPCNKAKKKQPTVFGQLKKQSPIQNVPAPAVLPPIQGGNQPGPKFPLLDVKKKNDPTKEALSCPFGFLLR